MVIEKMQMNQNDTSCSLFATAHQPWNRRRFSASCRSIDPVAGAATSSPVIGDTMRGM